MSVVDEVEQSDVIEFIGDEILLHEVIKRNEKLFLNENVSYVGTYLIRPAGCSLDQKTWKKVYYPFAQNLHGSAKKNGEKSKILCNIFVSISLKDSFVASEVIEFFGYFNDVEIIVDSKNPIITIRGSNPIIKQKIILENDIDEIAEEK